MRVKTLIHKITRLGRAQPHLGEQHLGWKRHLLISLLLIFREQTKIFSFVVEPVVSSPKDTTEANSMKRKELDFGTIPLTTPGRTSYERDCFQPGRQSLMIRYRILS